MAERLLTTFWIVPPGRHGPLGFGVTAHGLDDALGIIRECGFGDDLPRDLGSIRIAVGVRYGELEGRVRTRMGSIVVRWLWYPLIRVGM